jgi:ABC-2 type transport system ATP-binding protein
MSQILTSQIYEKLPLEPVPTAAPNHDVDDFQPNVSGVPAIQVSNLVVGYGSKVILNGLNLIVPQQSIFALLGPNGSGKTVLFKTLMDLQFARVGKASLFGHDTHTQGSQARAKTAMVSDSISLFGTMNALEHFTFGRKVQPKWDNKYALSLARDFDLPLKTPHARLSTGKRMLMALIYALASRPKLLLLDEPTNGLDPAARAMLFSRLVEFVGEGGTILISSHVLGEVENIADHLAILNHGRIVISNNLDQLRSMHSMIQMLFSIEPTHRELKEFANIPGVSQVKSQGRIVHLSVKGDPQTLALMLEPRYQPKDIQILPRTLEDVYLEYTQEGGL